MNENSFIQFSGIYNDNLSSNDITTSSILKFAVLGAKGIFYDIVSVIIDFNNSERKMYFVKACKKINPPPVPV